MLTQEEFDKLAPHLPERFSVFVDKQLSVNHLAEDIATIAHYREHPEVWTELKPTPTESKVLREWKAKGKTDRTRWRTFDGLHVQRCDGSRWVKSFMLVCDVEQRENYQEVRPGTDEPIAREPAPIVADVEQIIARISRLERRQNRIVEVIERNVKKKVGDHKYRVLVIFPDGDETPDCDGCTELELELAALKAENAKLRALSLKNRPEAVLASEPKDAEVPE